MVHQEELEHALVLIFGSRAPDVNGNKCPVIGIMDRKIWRGSLKSGAEPPGKRLDYGAESKSAPDLPAIPEAGGPPKIQQKTYSFIGAPV
jgi:hypothetical protein